MKKAVMISIQPKWCKLIVNGKKTIEVRKTKPKLEAPFKCYIYESSGNHRAGNENFNVCLKGKGRKKVIGEFVCKGFESLDEKALLDGMDEISDTRIEYYSCVSIDELLSYKGNKPFVYGWHISDLVIYDEPKELSEFTKTGALSYKDWLYGIYNGISESTYEKYLMPFKVTRPPQSWFYVDELI